MSFQFDNIKKDLVKIADKSISVASAVVNNDVLFDTIDNLPLPIKKELHAKYSDSSGPVLGIRKQVVDEFIVGKVNRKSIASQYEEGKKKFPKKFTTYKNLFSVLYPFVIPETHDLVYKTLEELAAQIRSDLNLTENAQLKCIGFDGGRNTGSEHVWFALYNNSYPNQKGAKQLFFSIHNGKIKYGLLDQAKEFFIDEKTCDISSLEYDDLVELFEKHKSVLLTDNFRANILSKYPLESLIANLKNNSIQSWLIKPGEKGSMWKKALKEENIRIGWGYVVNDIYEEDNYEESFVLEKLEEHYKNQSKRQTNNKSSILSFLKEVKVNDLVLAVSGTSDLIGVGIVTSDTELDQEDEEYKACHKVDWLIDLSKSPFKPGFNLPIKTVTPLEAQYAIPIIKSVFSLDTADLNTRHISIDNKMALNTIMYGPPGTGKTYNTIEKAISLANPSFAFPKTDDKTKDRGEVKKEFDRLKKLGQVYFTTFHQSLSYEDFIEGIKPLPPIPGQTIQYDVVPGLFKQACAMAAHNCYIEYIKSNKNAANYTFDDLYDAFITHVEGLLEKNTPPVYKTIQGRDVEIKEINKNDSIIARAKDSVAKKSAPLTKENIQKLYDRFDTIEEIEGLEQVRDTVQITPRITEFYAVFRGLKDFESTFTPNPDYIKESNESENFDIDEIQKKFDAGVYNEAMRSFGAKANPVVFVIDEINRGNVSQIFGELITLIEDDKRAGRPEALEAKLPYSKKYFSVPANLYIIGTMNTADRSVEALDTALRRRFAFEEKMPDPSLLTAKVDGIVLEGLLTRINERIELLLDRDHTIGHSYLINVKDEGELKLAFKNKILPLLQEYFYGDYGKIGLVLGTGFVNDNVKPNKTPFAPFKYPNGNDQFISQKCELIPINEDFKIIEAVKTLMSN